VKTTNKKRTRSSGGLNYFTSEHEQAILDYVSCLEKSRRDFLYKEYIMPVFCEMVDKIVFTYKFNTLPNIEDLKDECKTWLVTILDKYDAGKGSKAFSYFSVITKNWFIHKVKKVKNNRDLPLDEMTSVEEEEYATIENSVIDEQIRSEFKEFFFTKELNEWEDLIENDVEQKVYDALIILFTNVDDIQIFNKKAIYLYMREITGLNTKQVVSGLKKFRKNYKDFKYAWDNEGI
jgi:hypothetical protein